MIFICRRLLAGALQGGQSGRGRQAVSRRWAVSRAGRPPPLCVGADACIGPPAGLTNGWRLCVTARSRRLCRAGDFARRGALRHRRVCGTMRASSPTKHRARSCRFYRIFPSQSGNAPLRLVCGDRIALRVLKHTCVLRPLRCREAAKTGAVSEGRSYAFYRRTGDNKRSDGRLLHEKQLSPPQAALDSAAPCRGGFEGLPPERLPCKGSCRRQPTEGCGALPCQYPSGLPQTSPAGVNARPTMQGKRAAGPGTAGGVPALGSSPRWLAAPLRRGAWRPADVCRSVPVYGRNVGRAISPAAGPCGIAGLPRRCKHRPLRSTGRSPAGFGGCLRGRERQGFRSA